MEDNVFELKDFTYYSRIVMMIVLAIQFILFIIFIVFIHDVKDLMDKVNTHVSYFFHYLEDPYDISDIFHEQTQGIDTCISFFVISFVVFLIEFIVHFGFDNHDYKWFFFNLIFNSLNHLLTLLSFILAQFLYVIACLIIPIYLDRVTSFKDIYELILIPLSAFPEQDMEKIDSCIGKYAGLLVIAFVFLFIFIFLYFIIMNLYKGVCCDMYVICIKSNRCMGSFFGCFYDNVFFFCGACERRTEKINQDNKDIENTKREIEIITKEIQSKMTDNIKLRAENIDYL